MHGGQHGHFEGTATQRATQGRIDESTVPGRTNILSCNVWHVSVLLLRTGDTGHT